jgi:hypothetical protein
MAYVVNTSTDTFSQGQNHSGGVAVSPCGEAAVRTLESSLTEPEVYVSPAARMVERHGVGPQGLPLGDLRTLARPRNATSCLSELFGQLAQSWLVPHPVLVDRLVPRESTPVPLGQGCPLRLRARAQAEGVAHGLEQMYCNTHSRRVVVRWTRPDTNNGVVYRSTHHVLPVPQVSPPGHRRSHRPMSQTDRRRDLCRKGRASRPSSWRCSTGYTRTWSPARGTPIHSRGQDHQGQVVSAAPSGVSVSSVSAPPRCGPTRTASP